MNTEKECELARSSALQLQMRSMSMTGSSGVVPAESRRVASSFSTPDNMMVLNCMCMQWLRSMAALVAMASSGWGLLFVG